MASSSGISPTVRTGTSASRASLGSSPGRASLALIPSARASRLSSIGKCYGLWATGFRATEPALPSPPPQGVHQGTSPDQEQGQSADLGDRKYLIGLVGRGNQRENNADRRGEKSNTAQDRPCPAASGHSDRLFRRGLALQPDHRRKHQQVGNEVADNGHAYQHIVGPLHRRPRLPEKNESGGDTPLR